MELNMVWPPRERANRGGVHRASEEGLDSERAADSSRTTIPKRKQLCRGMEESSHKWTVEKTKALIRLRTNHEGLFTRKRNAAKQAWEFLIKEMELEGVVNHKQISKKWENLKKKYKELKKPITGSGTDQGEESPLPLGDNWFGMALNMAWPPRERANRGGVHRASEEGLDSERAADSSRTTIPKRKQLCRGMEESSNKWTVEKTKALIRLRTNHEGLFTRKRNAAKQAWEFLIKEMELEGVVNHKQISKKWENLKKKYKELKNPITGSGTDQGEESPATWSYYLDMHEALGSKPSMSPPVLIASCLSNPTILPPSTSPPECTPAPSCSTSPAKPSVSSSFTSPPSPACPSTASPSPSPDTPQPTAGRKRKSSPWGVLHFLETEAKKEDVRHKEQTQQTERFLRLFEKMVDKM